MNAAVRHRVALVTMVSLSVSLPGCDFLTGPDTELFRATVDTLEAPPTVPSAVEEGVSFIVEIPISAGCGDLGPVEVEEYGTAIVLEPYLERRVGPNVLCPGVLRFESHIVEVTWRHPTDFDVMIYAIDFLTGSPMLLRYPVEVRSE